MKKESQQGQGDNALLALARASIAAKFTSQQVRPECFEARHQACFVTLTLDGKLRGCIGTLEAQQPLALAVARYAKAAAFDDHRFAPLTLAELDQVKISISILGPMLPMQVASFDDLYRQLRPHLDGVTVQLAGRRATFLPQVWQSLPEPSQFIAALLQKAGLEQATWIDEMAWFRYQTHSISE